MSHIHTNTIYEKKKEKEKGKAKNLSLRRSREDNTIEIIRNVMNAFQEWVGCICIYVCSCV